MVRRVTPSQFQAMLRQAARDQQRAVNEYNRKIRQFNAQQEQRRHAFNRAVDQYNRKARAHNAEVERNRHELRAAIARLGQSRLTVHSTAYYQSTSRVHERYEAVEQSAEGTWLENRDDILDLAQKETENSIAIAAAADGSEPSAGGTVDDAEVAHRLGDFDADLADRWQGATFALNPRNPDAARHFSTSAREILTRIIESEAGDAEVFAAIPDAQRTHDGRPTRRARVAFCLLRSGRQSDALAAFADADLQNVIDLFAEFNDGTHGSAGVFDLRHLGLMRARVAGAIEFLHAVLRG